jgi:rare lipoprotein A
MKYANKTLITVSCAALLSSCASSGSEKGKAAFEPVSSATSANRTSDYPVKIGEPYKIGNISYTPQDVISYDEVGYASFYGEELAGQPTANGEIFVPSAITAAHKTLPIPSYAEITALDTGRTILVRINDRGPFANDRLIDLSAGAAAQLGITDAGVAAVRVRKVNPPEQERTVLRNGQKASERIETPDSLLRVLRTKLDKLPRPSGRPISVAKAPVVSTPRPVAMPSPAQTSQRDNDADGRFIREGGNVARAALPSRRPVAVPAKPSSPSPKQDGRFVREGAGVATPAPAQSPAYGQSRAPGTYAVQVASFNSRARADQYARKVGATVTPSEDGKIFRVRFGPYSNVADAQRGLATAQQRGYPEAKIFRE